MKGDPDDLTPLDARESLLMEDHEPLRRKDYSEMSRFNFTGPYQPYIDRVGQHDRSGSRDRLVGADPVEHPHARSLSQESQSQGRGKNSLEGRQATLPGFAF